MRISLKRFIESCISRKNVGLILQNIQKITLSDSEPVEHSLQFIESFTYYTTY